MWVLGNNPRSLYQQDELLIPKSSLHSLQIFTFQSVFLITGQERYLFKNKLSVRVHDNCVGVPTEARMGKQISWGWSYMWLWPTQCGYQELNSGSLKEQAVHALNHCAISPAQEKYIMRRNMA